MAQRGRIIDTSRQDIKIQGMVGLDNSPRFTLKAGTVIIRPACLLQLSS